MNNAFAPFPLRLLCFLLLAALPLAGCSDSLTAPEAPVTSSGASPTRGALFAP